MLLKRFCRKEAAVVSLNLRAPAAIDIEQLLTPLFKLWSLGCNRVLKCIMRRSALSDAMS